MDVLTGLFASYYSPFIMFSNVYKQKQASKQTNRKIPNTTPLNSTSHTPEIQLIVFMEIHLGL